jgi:Fe2+ or Zn2+ uptake regulation protein
MHMGRAQPEHEPMQDTDLLPSDRKILDVLTTGRATKGYIIDETGLSRNTVYNRLEVLEAAEHVRVVHEATRLFELTDDPRED